MSPPTIQAAPPLPPRHQQSQQEQELNHEEPPPAYTPSPDHDTSLLQVGPRYPFGPNPSEVQVPFPYNSNQYAQLVSHNYHIPPPPPSSQSTHQFQSQSIYPHQAPQQPPNLITPPNSQYSQNYIPITSSNEPTYVPTPGRPLLFEDKVLVYPYVNGVCYFCSKCCNTGFKGFDATRPCRKCWLKYGKPWQVVRLSPMINASMANLQRPLPPNGLVSYQPPPLVVRPGDPRIGGRLCLNCNGSGSKQEEINLFNVFLGGGGSEVCPSCRGTGRVF